MAKVGELETLVDNLVNRGLVSPKFVGRQVGQALIDELTNVGSDVARNQSILQQRQSSSLKSLQKDLLDTTGLPKQPKGSNVIGNKPLGILDIVPTSSATQNVVPTFRIRTSESGAAPLSQSFDNLNDVISFLRQNQDLAQSLAISGANPNTSLNDQQIRSLRDTLNIAAPRIAGTDARSALGGSQPSGLLSSLSKFNSLSNQLFSNSLAPQFDAVESSLEAQKQARKIELDKAADKKSASRLPRRK